MHIAKDDVPVRIDAPGAVARQQVDFGEAGPFGKMGAEYFSLGAGTDIKGLLEGLEGDLCQSPHWGYVLSGEAVITYADGGEERIKSKDLFYLPPGHSVRTEQDTELILFSPQHEHGHVIAHLKAKMGL